MTDTAATSRLFRDAPESRATNSLRIQVSRAIRFFQVFLGVVLGLGILRELAVAYLGTETALKDLRHFAFDAERSLPSWYDSFTMGVSAALLAAIAALARHGDRQNRMHWSLLAAIFLAMSIDASVSFHEVAVKPLRNAFDLSGVLYFSWVVVATPLVAAMGLYFLPFLLRLPRATAIRFIAAGAVFVGGALGTEYVLGYQATTIGMDSVAYRITAAVEEGLECLGMTLFVIALLRHLASIAPRLTVELGA
jgi:hypothetical protein